MDKEKEEFAKAFCGEFCNNGCTEHCVFYEQMEEIYNKGYQKKSETAADIIDLIKANDGWNRYGDIINIIAKEYEVIL